MGDHTMMADWPVYGDEEAKALLEVLNSGKWGSTSGDVVAAFQQEFAEYQQAEHAICLANGTLAIAVALRAAGVGIGDEVIVPPYTFIATASAALFVGAVPVFADVSLDTHLLDPAAAEAAITERTKAIVVVHLAGRPADMDAFTALGAKHGLTIIEDAAQAHGAAYKGRAVGAIGDLGTFSFQSSKNITAGEGGAVLTDSSELAGAVYSLVNVGRVPGGGWYQHEAVGYNLRLTEFQAAILRVQLRRHPALQELREHNAQLLTSLLSDVDGIQLAPEDPTITAHGRHLFMLRVRNRDAVLESLTAAGITRASSGYVPLHRNTAVLQEAKAITTRLSHPYPEPACPHADKVSTDTIWLPQPYLLGTDEETHALATTLTNAVAT